MYEIILKNTYYIDFKKLVQYAWLKYSSDLYSSQTMQDAKMIRFCMNNKADYIDFKTDKVILTYEKALELYESGIYDGDKDFKRCIQLLKADNGRYNRLIKRIMKFLEMGDCVFFTLTFTDEVLEATDENTRRQYVRRFLKSLSNSYIANIDFGEEKDREHYHGIIVLDDPDKIKLWKHGFSNAKFIRIDNRDVGRISHYILKLANHFVKKSVKRNYVIYSRM